MSSALSAARRAALLALILALAALPVLAGGQAAHADDPVRKLQWAGTADPVWDTRPGRDNFKVLNDKFEDTGKRGSFRDGDRVFFTDPKDQSVTIQGTVRPDDAFFTSGRRYTLTGSGTIAGPGGIHLFNGELVIENANTYTGTTTLHDLDEVTLTLGNDAALGSGRLWIQRGTLQPSGGVREVPNAIDLGQGVEQDDPLRVTLAGNHWLRLTGPIRLSREAQSFNLNVTNSSRVTVEDQVTEETADKQLVKRGPGTLEISGVTSHSGGTWVWEGELRLDTANIRRVYGEKDFDGSILVSDFVELSEPKLTGFGSIGGYLTAVEGVLDPGLDNDTPGDFVVGGNLTMFRSRYAVDIHGPEPQRLHHCRRAICVAERRPRRPVPLRPTGR